MDLVIDWDVCPPALHPYHDRLERLRRALVQEKILSCLLLHKDHVLLEYYRNNKIEHALQMVGSILWSIR